MKVEKLLTVNETAKILRLNPETVARYIREGKIPAIKFGRVWRVEEKDLEEFIKKRKTGAKK